MHLSTAQQDTLIRQLVYAAIYFLCLIAFYINIGQDMGAGYFLPILVPMVAVLMLQQHATSLPLFTKTGLVHLFAGLGWATAFPLLYTWTYNSVWYQSLICFDAVIGTAIWVTLTGLTGVLAKAPGKKPRALQRSRHALLRRMGFRVYVLDDVDEIPRILAAVKGEADEIHSA